MAIYNVNKDTGDITETAGKYGSSNSVFYGTIAQWNALSTAEKKAYDHASIPDSLDGNVTFPASKVMLNSGDSVEEKIGNVRMAKLWENPKPTAEFAGQNITLSSNDYNMLLVLGRYRNDYNALCPSAIGKDGYIIFPDYESGKSAPTYRRFTASSTTVSFGNCSRNGTINNNYLIPYQIYGIKLT